MPRDVLPPTEIRGARVYYLLELQYASRTWRLATAPLSLESEDGTLDYDDTLEALTWEDSLSLWASDADEASAGLSVILAGADVAELVELGHDLAAATGELSRWVEGTAYEDRQVLVRGRVVEPTYGATDEPVTFSLVAAPYLDHTMIPAARAVVDETTWPSHADSAAGAVYPFVFGAPGNLGGTRFPGSPAPIVHVVDHRVIIADRPVAATQVQICRADTDPTAFSAASVVVMADGLGRLVSTVIVPFGLWDAAGEYWISWPTTGSSLDRTGARAIHEAGDLLDLLLDLTTLRVDQGRMAAAVGLLRGYRVAGYIDERVEVDEWVRAHLLPILPISMHAGPDGQYPIVWRHQLRAEDAVAHLDMDEGDGERLGPVQYSPADEVRNEIVVAYALDAFEDRYTARATLTGQEGVGSSRRSSSHISRVSRARYGEMAELIETDVVCHAPTAWAIAAWRSYALGVPGRLLRYEVDPAWAWLSLGDPVTVTHSELSMVRRLAVVTGEVEPDAEDPTIALRTIDDPAGR